MAVEENTSESVQRHDDSKVAALQEVIAHVKCLLKWQDENATASADMWEKRIAVEEARLKSLEADLVYEKARAAQAASGGATYTRAKGRP